VEKAKEEDELHFGCWSETCLVVWPSLADTFAIVLAMSRTLTICIEVSAGVDADTELAAASVDLELFIRGGDGDDGGGVMIMNLDNQRVKNVFQHFKS
jgi:hypothetical protein